MNTKLSKPRREGASSSSAAGPLGEFVYDRLRADIREQRLLPGTRLREVEIAEKFGVSRTPVREALKRLATEGLLALSASRGFVVTELSNSHVMQLYAMREVLEGAAARFAAEQASPLEIQSLQQLCAQLEHAATPAQMAAGNRRLHDAIVAASHNVYLLQAMGVLRDTLELLGTTTYSSPGRMATGCRENAEIVERIAARDADGAEQAARRHIHNASLLRLKMLFGQEPASAPDSAAPMRPGQID